MMRNVNLEMDQTDRRSQSQIIPEENNGGSEAELTDRYGFLGGRQFTHESELDIPLDVIRKREAKWIAMLNRWDHFIQNDFKTIKARCRKGIPRSVRGRAWLHLCGGASLKNHYKGLYTSLLTQQADPVCVEDIRKDLHRTFPEHEIFIEDAYGQQDLFLVLKAYSVLNPKDGYCQSHSPIAATLLMHMPAEDAFWCLVAICDKYLKGYFSPGLEALIVDARVLFGLLRKFSPTVYKHFEKQNIQPLSYMTDWFSCVYTRILPWPAVLRVWDMFLCEGIKVTFRVGLILLKYTFSKPSILEACPTDIETLIQLKSIPNYVTDASWLGAKLICSNSNITKGQMKKEHYKQLVILRRQKILKQRTSHLRTLRVATPTSCNSI